MDDDIDWDDQTPPPKEPVWDGQEEPPPQPSKLVRRKNERAAELTANGWVVLSKYASGSVVRRSEPDKEYGIAAAYYTMLRERQEAAQKGDTDEAIA